MNQLTEVIRTNEYQWNYNWIRRRKLNLLRILKMLRNRGIQSCRFLFSLLLWRICSLIVISATEQTLLKRGCNNICGSSKLLVMTSIIYILIVVVRFIKKYLKDKRKCEEGNWKCNMENVPKINIWNSNTISRSHMKSHAKENLNHYTQCGREGKKPLKETQ